MNTVNCGKAVRIIFLGIYVWVFGLIRVKRGSSQDQADKFGFDEVVDAAVVLFVLDLTFDVLLIVFRFSLSFPFLEEDILSQDAEEFEFTFFSFKLLFLYNLRNGLFM